MPGCGTCHQLKGFLERHRVPVELRWLNEPVHQTWVEDHLTHRGRALRLPPPALRTPAAGRTPL